MVEPFTGKALARPGGSVQLLELAPGEERPLRVERSGSALLAALQGSLLLRFWGRTASLAPGQVVRVRPGHLTLLAPAGGRALLVVLGVSPGRLSQEHEEILGLLENPPTPQAAEALAQKLEAHISLEEALYYPTLSPGKRRERKLEHRLLQELARELLTATREGRPTEGVVDRLRTAFLAHAEAELRG